MKGDTICPMPVVVFLMHVLDVIFFAGVAGSIIVVAVALVDDVYDIFRDGGGHAEGVESGTGASMAIPPKNGF